MNWERETRSKLSHQEVAEQVLQIYTKSLQNQENLKSILSEYSVLDYFGKYFYGQEKVSSHLISNLFGSSYELSSLSINEHSNVVHWNPLSEPQDESEDDLGVSLISPPKSTFPSLMFSTPVRGVSNSRKRGFAEVSFESVNGEQSSSVKKAGLDAGIKTMSVSPETIQTMFPADIRYVTAYGTIHYPRKVLPTMDPKRIKHHRLISLRDRFCQLYIGFQCDEHLISVTNCKIWTIRYSLSSRVTPRNLLNELNKCEE